MQDRVPEARIYKVWLAPEWISDETTLPAARRPRADERQDLAALPAARLRGPDRDRRQRVLDEQRDRGRLRRLCDGGEGRGHARPSKRALDEELARFLADGPDARRARARQDRDPRRVHPRRRAESAASAASRNILAENAVYGGRPDFYKHSLGVLNGATPQQVLAAARKWLQGEPLVLEVHPFPTDAGAERHGRGSLEAADAADVPEAPFPALEQATLANGMRLIVAERHAVPVVQFSLQLDAGYAADQFAPPGVASMTMEMLDEGTATMDALEISDALAAPRRGPDVGREPRLLRRRPVRAQGEPRRVARHLRRRDPESRVRAEPSSSA